MIEQFYCGICGGLFNRPVKGNRKMWCDDCKPLAEKLYQAEYYKRRKAEAEQMRADAALGAAVRRMPPGTILFCHESDEWGMDNNRGKSIAVQEKTPEAVMIAAGLMKGEGKC